MGSGGGHAGRLVGWRAASGGVRGKLPRADDGCTRLLRGGSGLAQLLTLPRACLPPQLRLMGAGGRAHRRHRGAPRLWIPV